MIRLLLSAFLPSGVVPVRSEEVMIRGLSEKVGKERVMNPRFSFAYVIFFEPLFLRDTLPLLKQPR